MSYDKCLYQLFYRTKKRRDSMTRNRYETLTRIRYKTDKFSKSSVDVRLTAPSQNGINRSYKKTDSSVVIRFHHMIRLANQIVLVMRKDGCLSQKCIHQIFDPCY